MTILPITFWVKQKLLANKLAFGYARANLCKVESDEMHTIDLAKLTLFVPIYRDWRDDVEFVVNKICYSKKLRNALESQKSNAVHLLIHIVQKMSTQTFLKGHDTYFLKRNDVYFHVGYAI